MDAVKKAKLEAAGYSVGTVAEFLQLSPCEAEMIETRAVLANMAKTLRVQAHLTQAALAAKIHTDQARIAKMEAADPGVSTDFTLKALFALGASRKQVAQALLFDAFTELGSDPEMSDVSFALEAQDEVALRD